MQHTKKAKQPILTRLASIADPNAKDQDCIDTDTKDQYHANTKIKNFGLTGTNLPYNSKDLTDINSHHTETPLNTEDSTSHMGIPLSNTGQDTTTDQEAGNDRVQILLRLLELDHNKRITASELAP
ncbi:kinase [Fusarium mexicanum]|uniref:Kinase n=1 Tax=Fusarium mexicanum TaxID=751941 RepID=A0A8H5I4Y9_9HYPO|nr:kinase [Fusarium mexicanum]